MSSKVAKQSRISSKSKPITSPYLNSVYDSLNEQIDLILSDFNPTVKITVSYQRLYKFVEFLCRDKQQSKITANLYQKIDAYLTKIVELLEEARHFEGKAPLEKFAEMFAVLRAKMSALENIHLYLDRTYLLNHPTKKTLVKYTIYIFGMKMNASSELDMEVAGWFFDILVEYRNSGDEELPPLLIQSFNDLNLLISSNEEDGFKRYVLEQFQQYCGERRTILFENNKPEKIFDSLFEQVVRELTFWEQTSASETLKAEIKHNAILNFIFVDFDKLATKFVRPLFLQKNFIAISKLFKLIKNSVAPNSENAYLKIFANVWHSYICEYLESLLKQSQTDVVEKLVKSKKIFATIMDKYMESNSEIEFKLREAFRSALHSSNKDTEILNKLLKYIDSFFKNLDPVEHEENTQTINDIYLIFKSVKTKTTFIKQYQRDLSRRLINQTVKDKALEKALISHIQNEVGADQCKPLVTMFDDMNINDLLVSSFRQQIPLSETEAFEGFNPMVLNSKAWPVPKAGVKIPEELNQLMTEFQKFYLKRNQKKKLNWCPALSHMSINAHFKQGDKELQVNTFQGIVLLLFNEHDKLSFNQVKQMTELDSKNLSSILYSLTMGKYKILLKDSEGLYSMNENFEDRKKVVKVKQIQMKLKNGEAEDDVWMQETDDNMLKADKDEIIKAFIVRNMKNEKEMNHEALLTRILDQFIIEANEVKKIIQQLLDNEYIERLGTDRYRYVP